MELLAKSKDVKTNEPARTLREHIDDCLVIYYFLRHSFPKVAELSGMGDEYWQVLYHCVIFHDLGKAHNEFQKVLLGKPNLWDYQRHELFSIPFVEAISLYEKKTIQLMKWVIAGHHKDYDKLSTKSNKYQSGNGFGSFSDIEDKERFETNFLKNVSISDVNDLLTNYKIELTQISPKPIYGLIHGYLKSPPKLSNEDYLKVMLLFGGLKWCDHLGSAMVKNIQFVENKDFDFLEKQQNALKLKGLDFYEHQKKCSEISENLILTAPTGSGKTESAFIWLRNQMEINGTGRVFYVLPFTASINAMYERLDAVIKNEKVGMLHGKLSDYLNNYFDDLQYDLSEKKASIKEIKENFKSIVTPIKVCTPFQLLKHLFGLKGYEQGIFEMAGCYMIFDEIHAYSPEVFAQIIVLLKFVTNNLKAKVMIMTATMPRFLQDEIENSIGKFKKIEANQELFDIFRRHHIILKGGLLADDLSTIRQNLIDGKKVLVVCNTVKSAQNTYLNLKGSVKEGESVLLHGSFTGKDRSEKEKKLISSSIKLLVGTQAIEVSLDIDYEIIFTEPAPIDALIQRFGRVNRKRDKEICDCVVYRLNNKEEMKFYNSDIINKTLIAFDEIIANNNGIIDESILQKSIDFVYDSWNIDDREKFDSKYKYLSESIDFLSPMFKNKHSEEDFFEQFDGIKIVPQNLKNDFCSKLEQFDFISAESLKVQIRKGRFMSWKTKGNLKNDKFAFAGGKKIFSIPFQLTNKKYSTELGLLADEEDIWESSEFL